jgi:hypothetical protein
MEMSAVATFFDTTPVFDAYAPNAELFRGQPDLYDATERDSVTGWRRTVSARAVVLPSRKVVTLGGQQYIAGRVVKDFFEGAPIREHLLLHPTDGSFQMGPAASFLIAVPNPGSAYGALSWRKEQKEEGESSQFFNLYNLYLADTESATRDHIVKGPGGNYFRIQNVELTTGGLKTLVCSELGADVYRTATITALAGTFDPYAESSGTSAPILVPCFFERFQTNFRYQERAFLKFEPGDRVVTINSTGAPLPTPGLKVNVGGKNYKAVAHQSDGAGCYEIHVRPA